MVEKFTVVEWEEGEVGGLLAVWGSDYDALQARLAEAERLLGECQTRLSWMTHGKTHWEGCREAHIDCALLQDVAAYFAASETVSEVQK